VRALILTPTLCGADGVSAVSREVMAALRRVTARDELEVWSMTDDIEETQRDGSRIRGAGGKRWRFVIWAAEAACQRRHDVAIVLHTHLAPLVLPLVHRGVRIAVFLHGIEVWRPLGMLRRTALGRATYLIANSEYTALRFRTANPGIASPHVRVCYLGVPHVRPEMGARVVPRQYALIVGRMATDERYKGHDVLLEVWPDVLRGVPDANLVVVGDGDDRERLARKVEILGLSERVTFLGPVDDTVLCRLYRDCDFFVMPSVGEGFGLVFVEAMRAGKPCIAGVGAAAEVIDHGVTGLIVDPRRKDDLAAAVVRLFVEPQTRRAMGAAAAHRFTTYFSSEHFHERLLEALDLGKTSVCVG
jgi:phosphatidyl-myo-inositol dimannoside synthase